MGIVVAVALTTLAWTQASPGPRPAADKETADLSATASRSPGEPTTTAGASTTTTAQASGDGPKNLLANAGFEDGSLGWRPLGAARLTRSTEATEGGWSVRVLAGSSAGGPVGITVPAATVTKVNGRYHTNAWVRPSSPGTTVTIGLREYRGGRPVPGSNTLGWTVERTGWRQFGAIHVAGTAGSRLALEIMARDLPPGATSTSTRSSSTCCEAVSRSHGKERGCVGSGSLRSRARCCCWGCWPPAPPPPSRTTSTPTLPW